MRAPEGRRGAGRLTVVLGLTVLTLGAGYLLKRPCLGTPWDGRQYTALCYSDIYALYASDDRDRGLDEDRVPYVDGENEYPALNGVAMYVAALPATSNVSFFHWNVLLLGTGALLTAWALQRLADRRALYFALAPTLAIYAFMSWDLVAVALATLATLAYLRNRDVPAGVLLGLGAAAKLYPALLIVPFVVGRLVEGRRREAATIALTATAVWAAVNLPFAFLGFDRWFEFFRFNSDRPADWDSVWRPFQGAFGWETGTVNLLAAATFLLVGAVLVWIWWRRRDEVPAWTLGFPLLVAFLLTSKVYSPQYSLWLLPWFALAFPRIGFFVAFQVADAAVFVTRFEFFARYSGLGTGVPEWAFWAALLARAVVLVACVVAWTRSGTPRHEPIRPEPVAQAA